MSQLSGDAVQVAARKMYEAELALHDARTSGVDAWVAAAGDCLDRAVQRYLALTEAAAAPAFA